MLRRLLAIDRLVETYLDTSHLKFCMRTDDARWCRRSR